MGNDCFSLIRVCGCKGTDFSENMQYLEMMILFLKVHTKIKTGRQNASFIMRSNDRFVFISFSLK